MPDTRIFNNERWLSRGAILKRFAASLEHIKDFLTKRTTTPNYEIICRLQKLHFAVYLTSILSHFNKKLQGKGNTAHTLLEPGPSF